MRDDNRKAARRVALGGIISALSVLMLYFAAVFPTARLANVFIASLFSLALVYEDELIVALLCFAASSLLAFFLVGNLIILLPYVALFGWYPVFRRFIEIKFDKAGSIAKWALKYAACIVAAGIALLWAYAFVPAYSQLSGIWLAIGLIVALPAFAVYDWMLARLIALYGEIFDRVMRR